LCGVYVFFFFFFVVGGGVLHCGGCVQQFVSTAFFSHTNQPSKVNFYGQTENHYSSSRCSRCRLVKYASQLFIKNFHCKDRQQLDSTVTDVPLRAQGLDRSFYGFTKQFTN